MCIRDRVSEDNLILRIPIKREYIPEGGIAHVQLRYEAPDGRTKKSAIIDLRIKRSINAPGDVPSPLPSEFVELEPVSYTHLDVYKRQVSHVYSHFGQP